MKKLIANLKEYKAQSILLVSLLYFLFAALLAVAAIFIENAPFYFPLIIVGVGLVSLVLILLNNPTLNTILMILIFLPSLLIGSVGWILSLLTIALPFDYSWIYTIFLFLIVLNGDILIFLIVNYFRVSRGKNGK